MRAASGRYYDVAAEVGLGDSQNTRGIAIADVNGDGRLDFVRKYDVEQSSKGQFQWWTGFITPSGA